MHMHFTFIHDVTGALDANGCRPIAATDQHGKGHPVTAAGYVPLRQAADGTEYASLIVEHVSSSERCQLTIAPGLGKAWSQQTYGLGAALNSVLQQQKETDQ